MLPDKLLFLVHNEYNFLSFSEYAKFRKYASEEDLQKLDALAKRWEEADAVERELIADEVADIALGIDQ